MMDQGTELLLEQARLTVDRVLWGSTIDLIIVFAVAVLSIVMLCRAYGGRTKHIKIRWRTKQL